MQENHELSYDDNGGYNRVSITPSTFKSTLTDTWIFDVLSYTEVSKLRNLR